MRLKNILIVALCALALTSCGDDIDEAARAADEDTDSGVVGDTGPSTTAADEPDETSTTSTTAPKRADLELVNKGFAQVSEDTTGFGVLIRNPNSDAAASYVRVNISFFDAGGTVIGSEEDVLSVVLPGQTVAVGNGTDVVGVERMDVQIFTDDWETLDGPPGEFTAEGVQTVPEEYGGMKTTGLLKSTFAEDLQDIEVTAIYYDAAGAIVGGTFTYAAFVPANGSIGFELSTFNNVPNLGKTEVYPEITSLSMLGID